MCASGMEVGLSAAMRFAGALERARLTDAGWGRAATAAPLRVPHLPKGVPWVGASIG